MQMRADRVHVPRARWRGSLPVYLGFSRHNDTINGVYLRTGHRGLLLHAVPSPAGR